MILSLCMPPPPTSAFAESGPRPRNGAPERIHAPALHRAGAVGENHQVDSATAIVSLQDQPSHNTGTSHADVASLLDGLVAHLFDDRELPLVDRDKQISDRQADVGHPLTSFLRAFPHHFLPIHAPP